MAFVESSNLAARIAMQARLTTQQAEAALNALAPVILQAISNEDKPVISGLGMFQIDERQDGSKGLKFIQTRHVREVLND